MSLTLIREVIGAQSEWKIGKYSSTKASFLITFSSQRDSRLISPGFASAGCFSVNRKLFMIAALRHNSFVSFRSNERWKIVMEITRATLRWKPPWIESQTPQLARQCAHNLFCGNFLCKHQSRCKCDDGWNVEACNWRKKNCLNCVKVAGDPWVASIELHWSHSFGVYWTWKGRATRNPELRNYRAICRAENYSEQSSDSPAKSVICISRIVLGISISTVKRCPQS